MRARATSADAPDLISARAEIVELDTSALWTFEFDRPLEVPDDRGSPFRVDVVLRDPDAPVLSFGPYRGINRLIRYDAVADPGLTILLLPEAAENTFIPPRIDGSTMELQVPGQDPVRRRGRNGHLTRARAPRLERDRAGRGHLRHPGQRPAEPPLHRR